MEGNSRDRKGNEKEYKREKGESLGYGRRRKCIIVRKERGKIRGIKRMVEEESQY